jgi:hypothetical protein
VLQQQQIEEAARAINQRVLIAKASTYEELEAAFAELAKANVDAILVGADPYYNPGASVLGSRRLTRVANTCMRTSFLAILVGAAVLSAPLPAAQENAGSAGTMLPFCMTWLRVHSGGADAINDEIRSAGNIGAALSQFEKAGFCAGFVIGISEMLEPPVACIPNTASNEQLIQAVINFAASHPKTVRDDFAVLVGTALAAAWPCPKD